MKNLNFLPGLFLLLAPLFLKAEISTPKIFSDNMVLQRGTPVNIWGKSEKNADVEIEFLGEKTAAKADGNGNWKIALKPMDAVRTPGELKIYENGKLSKSITNVLVGEVWILGGQSNMEWVVNNTTDAENVKQRANYPIMRYFYQPGEAISETEQTDSPQGSKWQECNPQTAMFFSAMGFYSAEQVMKELDIPIGLVNTSFGGTAMRAWVPHSAISKIPFWQNKYDDFIAKKKAYNYQAEAKKWQDALDKYNAEAKKLKAEGKPVPPKNDYLKYNKPHKITPLNSRVTPSYLYNAKIAPIAGFSAKAILWNQGETDSWGETLNCYKDQLVALVESWRDAWKDKNMHFICVQLPSYKPEKWPDVRWNQYLACKELKNAHVVNIVDTGTEDDVHPREKCTAGQRVAKVALQNIYGKKNVKGNPPEPKSFKYSDSGVKITMDLRGAKRLEGKGTPRGFELLIDGKWQPAGAEIKGPKTVLVSALNPADNAKIEGVRYLWKGWALPEVWLYSNAEIPAITFENKK